MKKNPCGKCNVCCITFRLDKKFLSWRNTDKEDGEVCDKLINKRCVRYSMRPKPCKSFICLWLALGNDNKPEWRPDKVGFVVTMKTKNNEKLIMIKELKKDSLDFDNLNTDQDTFIKTIFNLKYNAILIQPFGHDKHYSLSFTPDKK